MIEAVGLTKRYGSTVAVSDLSFTVKPGKVTGFLGPNGAGKSTTMRMMLGLDQPTAGKVLFDGKRYTDLRNPLRTVGALVEASWVHPNRSAYAHLKWMARSNGIPAKRVDEVLDTVGLTEVARRKAGGFSLGMSQRLGIATALLGDPDILMFDEPVNGLDPEGINWIRRFMQRLAAEGRTVLVSSHLLSEMAQTAEELVVVGRGRLITQCTTEEFVNSTSSSSVKVRAPRAEQLREVLTAQGMAVAPPDPREPDGLIVSEASTERIGELAAGHGFVLHELSAQRGSLEDAFMRITGQDVEYRTGSPESALPGDSGEGALAAADK